MPFSITAQADYFLLRLSGEVVRGDITGMLQGMYDIEQTRDSACDAILVTDDDCHLDLHFNDLFPISRQLDQLPVRFPSLTAIVARSTVQTGLARMWVALAKHPNIQFEVFDALSLAEAWVREQRGR